MKFSQSKAKKRGLVKAGAKVMTHKEDGRSRPLLKFTCEMKEDKVFELQDSDSADVFRFRDREWVVEVRREDVEVLAGD